MRTRSQQYAAQVYEQLNSLQQLQRKEQKKYGALCHRFPLIVRENGLAAAFGFLAAKAGTNPNSPENLLLEHYRQILEFENSAAMQQKVVGAELPEYRRLTLQVLKLAEWFKRYAEGVLKVNSTGESTEDEKNDSNAS